MRMKKPSREVESGSAVGDGPCRRQPAAVRDRALGAAPASAVDLASARSTRPHPPWRMGPYRYVRRRWHVLFVVIDTLGWLAFRMARTVQRLVSRIDGTPATARDREVRSILIIQLDHIGDAVISTVLFPALRRHYPRAAIEVLCGVWNQELFEACAEVKRVHVSRVNRFARGRRGLWMLAIFWWGWKLKRRRFDLGIDVRGEFPIALLMWLAGVRRRAGWDCGGGGFLLTESPRYVPGRPEVESRAALLAELGVDVSIPVARLRPRFDPGPAARRHVAADTTRWASTTRPTFVLHVGAGTSAKRWPVDHWCELVRQLRVARDVRVLLVGDRSDSVIARRIAEKLSMGDVIDLTGRYGLRELAALIGRAELFIGTDSGPAHLAAAVDTPAVVLFSGTNDTAQWRPCGSQVLVVRYPVPCAPCHHAHCPLTGHPCMSELRPAAVMQAIAELVDDPNHHSVARWLDLSAGSAGDMRLSPAA